MTRVAVISGGLREPSSTRLLADRLAAAARERLPGNELDVIELRPLGRAIVDAMLIGFAAPELASAFDSVAGADGLIAVTPAFNASFSGLFKSFFDVLPDGTLEQTPVLIGATGGTERHSLVLDHALRPMFSHLHAVVSPVGVYAATADFGAGPGGAALAERIDRAAGDFTRLLLACGERRRDEFDEDLIAIQHLLGGDARATETKGAR